MDGTRVHAVGADEIWTVDFMDDGRLSAEAYRLTSEKPITDPSALESLFGRMARSWSEAALDLGFRFESPFTFYAPSGRTRSCAGYLPDFGGRRGALIVSREDPIDAAEAAEELGYYVSALSPRYYERYDRTRFIDTLSDWGWFGSADAPSWLRKPRR